MGGTESSLVSSASKPRRTITPYDLTAGDNPGILITKPLLRGPNYDEWATNIRLALKARKKFGFADGSLPQPLEDSPDYEDWSANNALVVSWMKLTVDENLSSSMSHIDDAQELWTHIQKRFGVKNGQRVQRLKTELATCRQKGLAIDAYYGKLTQLWRSLADYQKAKTMEEVRKEREEDKLHQFLMGLDETEYGAVKSALLSRVPLPSLEEAYNTLTQDEESKSLGRMNTEKLEGVSFAVQTTPRPRSVQQNRGHGTVCTECGKSGHSAENCFRRIGYPDWWEERSRQKQNTSSSRSTGTGRGNVSATGNTSHANHAAVISPNARGLAVSASPVTSHTLTNADRVGISGLSDAQWKTLVHMLDEHKLTSDERPSGKQFLESWVIDSGASNHMTGTLECLLNISEMPPVMIKLPDGRFTSSTKHGCVPMGSSLRLKEVYFVDGLDCHLISVSQLTRDNGCLVQMTDQICVIQECITQTLIGVGRQRNGLYFFRGVETIGAVQQSSSLTITDWHRRLGHPSSKALELLKLSDFSSSVFESKKSDVCLRAKQARDSFPLSTNKTSFTFEMIHCDLWGPYRTTSMCGACYFLTIVDDFSRAVWIYLRPTKKDAPIHLKNFLALVERQFSTKVKIIRSDNGTEFTCLSGFFTQNGIIHETSCVGTPQQNGRVERKHRHILNVARALRFQSGLPVEFWGYCALTAGYLINRTPTAVFNGKTPFELVYKRPPPLNHLRVFGSLCYVHNQNHRGDKFATRSNRSVFLGYPFSQKGWRVYDMDTGVVSVSRDVIFIESPIIHDPSVSTSDDDVFAEPSSLEPEAPLASAQPATPATDVDNASTSSSSENILSPAITTDVVPPSDDVAPLPGETGVDIDTLPPEPFGRGHRTKRPPTKLADYVATLLHSPPPSATPYPLDNFLSSQSFSPTYQAYVMAITKGYEPRNYEEAVLDEHWRLAVREEIDACEESGTWTVEVLPPGKKALGCKWVFRLKFNAEGKLVRYKARLVVLGNHQTEGEDFNETFAPVAKMITVRAFLQQAASRDWEIHQMDVHNAFLHGDLDEEIYMQFPPGFRTGDKTKVCRLRKSLYGLKQAPRCWYAKLATALKEYGFQQNDFDHSLFTFQKGDMVLVVLVYVDDLIITGSKVSYITEFKSYLSTCFRMKDLGILRYFLGIEIARNPSGIYMCQRKYALDIITETGLLGVKPASFPLEQHHQLARAEGETLQNPTQYRRLIGKLIYLGVTRPDLSYVIHILSQFMNSPKSEHWDAALRVVRYLKQGPGQGILLRAHAPLTLTAWCDADWGACPLTRRSLTGWFIQLGGSPLSWKTMKQDVVSRSSAEAEYRAMADTVTEILWLRNLLPALGVDCTSAITLYSDSLSAIHLAANPVFHARTKQIGMDCHFIRNEIIKRVIQTKHVSTKSQLADIMTKALGRREFESFLVKMGVCNLHTPS